MSREYNPDIRENDPIYLLGQVKALMQIALNNKSSSALIYACLDCRIALELADLNMILASVKEDERYEILLESKSKNGIDRINKKKGSLKLKYQQFFQAFCEIVGIEKKLYNFKKSKELQHQLSNYIHSYYMSNDDLNFTSDIMQNSILLIKEVKQFIENSLILKNEKYELMNIVIESIPLEDQQLLNDWKLTSNMDFEEMKMKLLENLNRRKQ